MKVCKVHPSKNECCCCIDEQLDKRINKECADCITNQPEHEILKIFTTFFGKVYVLVIVDGKIEKVPINRIYGVREVQPMIGMGGNKYGY